MKNKINLTYNKYNFYHNEWYFNIYSYNKYKKNYNVLFIDFIYSLLNMYFNKINIFNKKRLKKSKKILSNFSNIKEYYISDVIYNNIINMYKYNNIKNNKLYKSLLYKIYFNIIEIKYYSNKIIIHIYVYNREKIMILKKLKLLKIIKFINKRNIINTITYNNINLLLKDKLDLLNNKIYLYRYYTSMLFINNLKFNIYNLLKIKGILNNILLKKVSFNITNIKYIHLSSNILLNSLSMKLNKNRKSSILKLIRKGLRFAKIAKLHFLLKIKKLNTLSTNEIKNNYKNVLGNEIEIINKAFYNSANIHITGLRLEAKGRLTKRLVAARTIRKYKYKGSLGNIYSSINKNSVITFKGIEKSNISFYNKNSYNILGSYGLKYWVSSY